MKLLTEPRTVRFIVAAASGILLALMAFVVAHGTLRTFALGLAVAVVIPLAYIAIEHPLIFPFGVYVALVPFEEILGFGKVGTINKLLGVLSVAAIALAILRRGEFCKPSPAVVAWMVVGFWMGLTGLWTIDQKDFQIGYLTFILNFCLYALIAMTIATRSDIEFLCTSIVTGGLLAAAFALWPLMHGTPLGPDGRITLPGANPFDPPDPNQFAAALLLPFAILFAATLSTRQLSLRVINCSGLLLLAITIVLSGSRAAMLAILVLGGYMIVRSRHRAQALMLAGLAALAIVPFGAWIQSRFSNAVSSGGAGRADIWRVALVAFHDHTAFGSGFASFPVAFDDAVMRAPLIHYIGWHRGPHDLIVSTAVELGVVGLILVGAALVIAFRDLSIVRGAGFLGDLRIALQATLLGICVDAVFLDMIDRKYFWLLFMMIALVRSTLLAQTKTELDRRRTLCEAHSSLTPVPTSEPARLSA
ncbi:MAG TPA: O-antigen ligase family protein [Candidatus Acidoferrales bacterium]|nr:O-antigen ligase family protein [Candidatus Acidoferrales bacterium]